jgi:hypothetical protein
MHLVAFFNILRFDRFAPLLPCPEESTRLWRLRYCYSRLGGHRFHLFHIIVIGDSATISGSKSQCSRHLYAQLGLERRGSEQVQLQLAAVVFCTCAAHAW